jgi:hypothetical protein
MVGVMPLDAGQALKRALLSEPNLSEPLALQVAGDYERLLYEPLGEASRRPA